jgi:hypothetical protein
MKCELFVRTRDLNHSEANRFAAIPPGVSNRTQFVIETPLGDYTFPPGSLVLSERIEIEPLSEIDLTFGKPVHLLRDGYRISLRFTVRPGGEYGAAIDVAGLVGDGFLAELTTDTRSDVPALVS